MSAVVDEKTTLSTLLRNIINGFNEEHFESVNKGVKQKRNSYTD